MEKDGTDNSWAVWDVMLKTGKIKRPETRAWGERVCLNLA